MRELTTVDEVIEALGGAHDVAKRYERNFTAICNWRRYGHFPTVLWLRMSRDLHERGVSAAPFLWKFEGATKPLDTVAA